MNLSADALKQMPLGYICLIFRGLNFESNDELEKKSRFEMGTI